VAQPSRAKRWVMLSNQEPVAGAKADPVDSADLDRQRVRGESRHPPGDPGARRRGEQERQGLGSAFVLGGLPRVGQALALDQRARGFGQTQNLAERRRFGAGRGWVGRRGLAGRARAEQAPDIGQQVRAGVERAGLPDRAVAARIADACQSFGRNPASARRTVRPSGWVLRIGKFAQGEPGRRRPALAGDGV